MTRFDLSDRIQLALSLVLIRVANNRVVEVR